MSNTEEKKVAKQPDIVHKFKNWCIAIGVSALSLLPTTGKSQNYDRDPEDTKNKTEMTVPEIEAMLSSRGSSSQSRSTRSTSTRAQQAQARAQARVKGHRSSLQCIEYNGQTYYRHNELSHGLPDCFIGAYINESEINKDNPRVFCLHHDTRAKALWANERDMYTKQYKGEHMYSVGYCHNFYKDYSIRPTQFNLEDAEYYARSADYQIRQHHNNVNHTLRQADRTVRSVDNLIRNVGRFLDRR